MFSLFRENSRYTVRMKLQAEPRVFTENSSELHDHWLLLDDPDFL